MKTSLFRLIVLANVLVLPISMHAQYLLSATAAGAGIVVPDPIRASYAAGTVVKLTATPALGWEFQQWFGDAQSADPVIDIVMNGDRCVEGVFATRLHSTTSGNGFVSVSPLVDVYPYASEVLLVATPAAGHYFTGWSGGLTGNSNPLNFTVLNENDTVHAAFAPLSSGEVSLTVVPDGFGRVSISPRANRYTIGQVVTLTAKPETGQLFTGWDDTASVVNPLALTLEHSVTVVARFTKKPMLDVASCVAGVRPDGFRLLVRGEFGAKCRIDRSRDLEVWDTADILTLPYGAAQYTDPRALTDRSSAYRAVVVEADTPANPDPARFVWIPPGTFTMGSPESEEDRAGHEGPQTQVTLTKGYWMGKYEVTQREYSAVMGNNPSYFNGLSRPVEEVCWFDATNYCAKLTAEELAAGRLPAGQVYRLPTDAEWEYACRAGTTTRFSYGDDPGYTQLGQYAWYAGNSSSQTHPVGQKLANPWGLYDMHGNVHEWCADWLGTYPGGTVSDPKGPDSGWLRVIRGGNWHDNGEFCRSAFRGYGAPELRFLLGFRVVLAPELP